MKIPFNRAQFQFNYGERLQPARDWFILLVLTALVFSLSAVWSIWLFGRVANGDLLTTATTTTPSVFSKESLDAVQEVFTEREAEETKYATGEYSFIDPMK